MCRPLCIAPSLLLTVSLECEPAVSLVPSCPLSVWTMNELPAHFKRKSVIDFQCLWELGISCSYAFGSIHSVSPSCNFKINVQSFEVLGPHKQVLKVPLAVEVWFGFTQDWCVTNITQPQYSVAVSLTRLLYKTLTLTDPSIQILCVLSIRTIVPHFCSFWSQSCHNLLLYFLDCPQAVKMFAVTIKTCQIYLGQWAWDTLESFRQMGSDK